MDRGEEWFYLNKKIEQYGLPEKADVHHGHTSIFEIGIGGSFHE